MQWKLLRGLYALLISSSAFSQAETDTAFIISAKKNTINLHQRALGAQARLYNGSKYLEPELTFEHHPFFISEDWMTGSVFYDGEYFQNVPLMYDLLNDALITEHVPSGHAIRLVREKLRHFTIGGHYFELIEKDSVQNSLPRSGFYDVLHSGKTRVVASRQKFRRDDIESMRVNITYEEKNRYFILRNGVFFPVKSKASVLKLMADKKHELKRLLKQNSISFSDDRELALKSTAQFYDTLK